jgi:hypothetical protein
MLLWVTNICYVAYCTTMVARGLKFILLNKETAEKFKNHRSFFDSLKSQKLVKQNKIEKSVAVPDFLKETTFGKSAAGLERMLNWTLLVTNAFNIVVIIIM